MFGQTFTKKPSNSRRFHCGFTTINIRKSCKMVSKLFCLPSKSTILKWIYKMPESAGLTQSSVDVISTEIQTMGLSGSLHNINGWNVFEISQKSQQHASKDKIIGLRFWWWDCLWQIGNIWNCPNGSRYYWKLETALSLPLSQRIMLHWYGQEEANKCHHQSRKHWSNWIEHLTFWAVPYSTPPRN